MNIKNCFIKRECHEEVSLRGLRVYKIYVTSSVFQPRCSEPLRGVTSLSQSVASE